MPRGRAWSAPPPPPDNTPRVWSEPAPNLIELMPEPIPAPQPAHSAPAGRGWGWLVAAGGVAFAIGPFLPWLSLHSGFVTLTESGADLAQFTGSGYSAHVFLAVAAGFALAILGVLLANGQNVRWAAILVALAATAGALWELVNIQSGQARLDGGATLSLGIGLFLMLGGGIAALLGTVIPALDQAAQRM
jgi:hypothetical protein